MAASASSTESATAPVTQSKRSTLLASKAQRLRIAINAISTIHGGGAVALEKLLTQFVALRPEHEFHVIANTTLLDSARIHHPSVRFHHFPWAQRSYARTSLWYMTALPLWLRRNRIDVLFSQTCYLPPVRPRRSTMLLQDARYFTDTPRRDSMLTQRELVYFGFKKRWVDYSVRHADNVIVQSEVMANLVAKEIPEAAGRLCIVHHGPGFLDGVAGRPKDNGRVHHGLELAYVSLYRPYKNFSVLFRTLRLLQSRGIEARLHLTLDPDDSDAQRVIADAHSICSPGQVVNHGVIDHREVASLYQGIDVVVFPSLCESFGFPQIEAMALGLPVVASDTPINREVCGPVASYFSADDEQALAKVLERFYREPAELTRVSNLSMCRAGSFDWSTAAQETLKCLEGE